MIKGSWEHHQTEWHCNLKEMYAVRAAISSRTTSLQDSRIILQCDNRTVVFYKKNEGGSWSRQLLDLTQNRLALVDHFNVVLLPHHLPVLYNTEADHLNVVLLPHHLPGLYNTEADHLSRNHAGSEWHLTEEATTRLFNLWETPDSYIRVTDSTRSNKLCYSRLARRKRLFLRRLQQILARSTGMVASTVQSDTQGARPPQLSIRSVQNSGTQVEEAFLASTFKIQRSEQQSGGHVDNDTACLSQQSTPGSLSYLW
ncbi:uncharacterized protein LOC124535710 [Vanessa cardui]|uniref:uncharacterized protein LOC124535710 n=1 Tax=Vanessa cardui TaxID=171605 RepID=UPI001F13A18E|nr:uncharacterized protein LOC124535710 [Vanessa cardui]